MKNIRIFYLKIFKFLVVKFSIYLNRRVFIMSCYICKIVGIFFKLYLRFLAITKLLLFKYIENFTTKNEYFKI